MLEIGVKTIVYSITDGIKKMRLIDFKPLCSSLGRLFIQNGFNAVYRNQNSKHSSMLHQPPSESTSDSSSIYSDTTTSSSDIALSTMKQKKKKKKKKRMRPNKHY